MPYVKETCKAGRTVEVIKYYSYHLGKKWIRDQYRKPTGEQQKKANRRKALKELRRLLNANFEDGKDCLVTLTFRPEERPKDRESFLKIMQNYIKRLARRYKQTGYKLKYVYCLEMGPRGAVHAHMVVNWNHALEIHAAWGLGFVQIEPLYSDGQYSKIAEYFLKYSEKETKEEKESGKKIGRNWYASKGLVKPEPVKEVVNASTFRGKPPRRKGYRLDPDSIVSATSEVTGLPYVAYTYIKEKRRGKGCLRNLENAEVPKRSMSVPAGSRRKGIPRGSYSSQKKTGSTKRTQKTT